MDLLLKNGDRERVVDWRTYALLRDNVQHYLELGQPQPSFRALHAIEEAIDGTAQQLPAGELRDQVQFAWSALAEVTLGQSAVSLRTRALMTGCREAPGVRGTVLARVAGWEPPVQGHAEQPLRELLGDFVAVLLWLTERSSSERGLHVVRL